MMKFLHGLVCLVLAGCGLQAHQPQPAPKEYQEMDYRVGEIPEFEVEGKIADAWNETVRESGREMTRTVGKSYWAFKNVTSHPLDGMKVLDVLVVDEQGYLRERALDVVVMAEGALNDELNISRHSVLLNQPWEIGSRRSFEIWVEWTVRPEEIRTGKAMTLVLVMGLKERVTLFRTDLIRVSPLKK